jgi:hypothetical protein
MWTRIFSSFLYVAALRRFPFNNKNVKNYSKLAMKYTNQALFKIFKMNCCPLEKNLHYFTMQLPAHFKTGEPLSFKPNVSSIKLKISHKVS